MVKRSKKSKSKRTPLKKKYKILKRVKQHHKKKAKEAKKLGLDKKPKAEKDPGIPNDWPFKEQELKALEVRRQRAIEELEEKKAARKERAKKRKLGLLDDEKVEGDGEEEMPENPTSITRKVDNPDKALYKELVKVIDASDVIVEVLDARDPLGTRCADIEKMVMPDKHRVLVLNKIDLVPREAVEKWLKYLREEFPDVVAFKCSTQAQKSNPGWKSGPKATKAGKKNNHLQMSDCLGAEILTKLLKKYSGSDEVKKSITVGFVGLPNVGKSSIINSLKKSHVVNVGAIPGLTKSMQEVHFEKNVILLDCPSVVMLKSAANDASTALRNCTRIEKLEDPIGPVKEILKLCPDRVLVTLYNVPVFDSVDDFLQKVATVRGKLKKDGAVYVNATAKIILHDWNEGKIPYYTMPPKRNAEEPSEATIVTKLGQELNVDEIYGSETSYIGSLKSLNDFNPVEVPANCPLNFDMTMLEDKEPPQAPPQGNGDDEPMESGEDGSAIVKEKSATGRQKGMQNTKSRKADKRRQKKESQSSTMEHDGDDDYNFKVDYVKESAMETGDEVVVTDKTDKNSVELPSGAELDNK